MTEKLSEGDQINGALANLLGELALGLYLGKGSSGDVSISRRLIPSVMCEICKSVSRKEAFGPSNEGIQLTKKVIPASEAEFQRLQKDLKLLQEKPSEVFAFAIAENPGIIVKVSSPGRCPHGIPVELILIHKEGIAIVP